MNKIFNRSGNVFRYIHEWRKEGSSLFITTIPMVHIGKTEYYKRVSEYLNSMNHILYEGIEVSKKLNKDYYKYIAKILKLETQFKNLIMPKDTTNINIDMDYKTFKKKLNMSRFKLIIYFSFLNIFVWFNKKKKELKNTLIEILGLQYKHHLDLVNPLHFKYYKSQTESSLFKVILIERDEIFRQKIKQYICENLNRKYRIDTAIIVGSAHMSAIYNLLDELNFKWKLLETVDIM